jgi:hypothetical protein
MTEELIELLRQIVFAYLHWPAPWSAEQEDDFNQWIDRASVLLKETIADDA